ncbi:MAG: cysteine hydrolase, partial [Immundisolibacteraceae bacterium]|nr:cysteine hydrolase [Immundisolibacteraceae bacterium]
MTNPSNIASAQTNNSVLLIIDMQNDFVLPGAPMEVAGALATLPNITKVLNQFRQQQLPVFHVVREHRADGSDVDSFRRNGFEAGEPFAVPGTKGCEIVEQLSPIETDYRLVKPRFSAFMQTELDFMLRRLQVDQLVVCGTQYPNCIRATIFDAISLDYGV